MRKYGLILMVALLATGLVVGGVACSKKKKTTVKPTATTAAATETPVAGTPVAGETPTVGGPTSQPGAFTTVVATANPALGTILTTFDGYTLYTFDNDSGGVPTCTGACANTWPPLVIPGTPTAGAGVSGTLGVVARDDGSMQVTLDGKPLYMNSSDASVGDTKGDGSGGLWHVVSLG